MLWIILGSIFGVIVLFVVVVLVVSSARTKKMDAMLVSPEVRQFEAANAVKPEERRWLVFGTPLMYANRESPLVFALMHADKDVQGLIDGLAYMWRITDDGDSTLETLDLLANAKSGTQIAQEMYTHFVATQPRMKDGHLDTYLMKTQFNMTMDKLPDLMGLQATLKFCVSNSAEAAEDYIQAHSIVNDGDKEQVRRQAALEYLVAFINRCVKAYEATYYTLTNMKKEHRYSKADLDAIQNFEAWDYGRTAYVARNAAALGYITQAEAMPYIKQAAENASKAYNGWREYIAAYYLGRTLSYGGEMRIFADIEVLFNEGTSPFEGISFK